jgi:Uma2 family endonuclease
MPMAVEVSRRRFTADEYLAMGDAGILRAEDRVELIDGDIVAMTPIGRRHVAVVNRLTRFFVMRLGVAAIVQPQGALRLDVSTEPQPDLAVLRHRDDFYETGSRPAPDDILLLIEVADTSLRYDLTTKAALYASYAIAEYWVIDLNSDTVIRHQEPVDGAYQRTTSVPHDTPFAPALLPGCLVTTRDILG